MYISISFVRSLLDLNPYGTNTHCENNGTMNRVSNNIDATSKPIFGYADSNDPTCSISGCTSSIIIKLAFRYSDTVLKVIMEKLLFLQSYMMI